jgi:hypothetical protein
MGLIKSLLKSTPVIGHRSLRRLPLFAKQHVKKFTKLERLKFIDQVVRQVTD